jgi:pyruvate kinase
MKFLTRSGCSYDSPWRSGVQIPIEDVPAVQKKLIRKANLLGRPVITATQMLLSMTENIRPTRAEASDVANAILTALMR